VSTPRRRTRAARPDGIAFGNLLARGDCIVQSLGGIGQSHRHWAVLVIPVITRTWARSGDLDTLLARYLHRCPAKGPDMRVAVPLFGTRVSPPFDCGAVLLVADVEDGKVESAEQVVDASTNSLERVARLRQLRADAVIRGAITGFVLRRLAANGIRVYPWVSSEASEAAAALAQDRLPSPRPAFRQPECPHSCGLHLRAVWRRNGVPPSHRRGSHQRREVPHRGLRDDPAVRPRGRPEGLGQVRPRRAGYQPA